MKIEYLKVNYYSFILRHSDAHVPNVHVSKKLSVKIPSKTGILLLKYPI